MMRWGLYFMEKHKKKTIILI